jgi:hypothetical protein
MKTKKGKRRRYKKMSEINNRPSNSRRTTKHRKNKDPCEEKDENIGSPNTRIRKPFCVPVQIRWRHSFHIQICHQNFKNLKIPF